MSGKISRRKMATYIADSVADGLIPAAKLEELAAYIIDSRRQRELTLIVRAIEDALAERGVVVATVTSAFPLDEALRTAVASQVDATEVRLREVIDPSVIGGVRLQTPSAALDTTIAHKLTLLQGAKV